MGYQVSSLDELGEGYGFRKVRQPLGVTRVRRQRARVPARLRRPEPLPRPAGRAVLRPPRDGDVHVRRRRARGRRGRARPRRVDDAPDDLEPHRRRPRALHRRAARTATSSATASSSSAEDLAKRVRRSRRCSGERADDGLPADAADDPAPRRGVLRRQGDRHAAPRQELPPHTYARELPPRARARGRAAEPRPRARRPRRDALLEPLPAPRGVSRHPVRRLRAAHAQPAPASERPRLHRDSRAGHAR